MNADVLDRLVRLSLGLPDPGRTQGEDPIMHAGVRGILGVDSYKAGEEVRVNEVLEARRDDRQTDRSADREARQQDGKTRSL